MHTNMKQGQNNHYCSSKEFIFSLFSFVCPILMVNFAEWATKGRRGFAKSLSEKIVTQKSFEQRRGQWESDGETEADSKPRRDYNHASRKEATEGSLKGNGSHHQHKFKMSRCSGSEISHSWSPTSHSQ